jgi:hypothetical protein
VRDQERWAIFAGISMSDEKSTIDELFEDGARLTKPSVSRSQNPGLCRPRNPVHSAYRPPKRSAATLRLIERMP